MTLEGQRVLVIGGTGGLGEATTRMLISEGAVVRASYLANRERAEQVAPEAELMAADITRSADRARLLDPAPFGLAVFAGNPARVSAPAELESTLRLSQETNFLGPLLAAREAADAMRRDGIAGSIVLIASMQATSVFPGSTAYATAKAALVHGARILARECRGPANIRVNVVAPGVNAAGMAAASIASGKYNRYLEDGVVHRFGKPEDVARVVRMLLEPDSYITGQVITVDGGLTL